MEFKQQLFFFMNYYLLRICSKRTYSVAFTTHAETIRCITAVLQKFKTFYLLSYFLIFFNCRNIFQPQFLNKYNRRKLPTYIVFIIFDRGYISWCQVKIFFLKTSLILILIENRKKKTEKYLIFFFKNDVASNFLVVLTQQQKNWRIGCCDKILLEFDLTSIIAIQIFYVMYCFLLLLQCSR